MHWFCLAGEISHSQDSSCLPINLPSTTDDDIAGNKFQLFLAPDFETSLSSVDESVSTSLESFRSLDCEEDVATLIVRFARANIDRYCFCCPLMALNKSVEQVVISPDDNKSKSCTGEEEWDMRRTTTFTSSSSAAFTNNTNNFGPAFEETFLRTFTSTPRKVPCFFQKSILHSLFTITIILGSTTIKL